MTRVELVEKVAEAVNEWIRDQKRRRGDGGADGLGPRERFTQAEAEVVVNTVVDSIVEALHRGEKIELRGFGSFRLRMRRPRQGRNPKTGTRVEVPGKAVPYFKPGKELRELLNPGGEGADLEIADDASLGEGEPGP
ncbi:MAG: integration host factor subunit beta [Acidobacteria bacterium]|nr:integration host factor subunit beta [Acidobacteriota bacterium]